LNDRMFILWLETTQPHLWRISEIGQRYVVNKRCSTLTWALGNVRKRRPVSSLRSFGEHLKTRENANQTVLAPSLFGSAATSAVVYFKN